MYDSHFHIIDMRYPVQENQGFFPPSFSATDYQQRTRGLGISGGNVVSGSFQGFDTGFMFDALKTLGPTFTGVIQIPSCQSQSRLLDVRHRPAVAARAPSVSAERHRLAAR